MSLGSKLYEVSQRARQCLNRWRIATKGGHLFILLRQTIAANLESSAPLCTQQNNSANHFEIFFADGPSHSTRNRLKPASSRC